jgi:hypothetical protein
MVNNVYLGFFDKFNLLQSSHGFTYYFCCEEMTENNDKKIEVEQANNMTFITHGFRAKSRTLSCTSDTTETRNPCVIKVMLLACSTSIKSSLRSHIKSET